MEYEIRVNEAWVQCVHQAVSKYLDTWPGGDPMEQEAYKSLKCDLDRLALEIVFNNN